MADPEFYKGSGNKVSEVKSKMEELEVALISAYKRWEELETIKEATS